MKCREIVPLVGSCVLSIGPSVGTLSVVWAVVGAVDGVIGVCGVDSGCMSGQRWQRS